MSDEPDPIVTRSITIAELMDGDGDCSLSYDIEGGMETWDVIGFLEAAMLVYRQELVDRSVYEADDD